jgi:stage II sporulation protein D
MNRFLILIITFFFSFATINGEELQDIKIKLFSSYNSSTAILSVKKGIYYLVSQNRYGNNIDTIAKLNAKDKHSGLLYLWVGSGKIRFNLNKKRLGGYDHVILQAADGNSTFKVSYGHRKERIYDGSLIVNLKNNNIELINKVDMQSYVAGVVESEIGSKGNLEFYKVQAILVRTYALKNFEKFINYGYNLTDDVRSQVYFSKSYYSNNSEIIHRAVKLTKDMVIVGQKNSIIDPVFHANSGGQTMKAADVWNFEFPYLQSVRDPFSTLKNSDNANWEKEIPKDEFIAYFTKIAPKYKNDKNYKKAILSFRQNKRMACFIYKDVSIPLKDVRRQFRLKSSFFSVSSKRNVVVLHGKGYGHGVGLSQIGAINMVKRGFNYEEIIKFYFKGVSIVKLNESLFAYNK